MTAPSEHQYGRDDRCICGGIVVFYEDALFGGEGPVGNGCDIEGKPWAPEVRNLDPQERPFDDDGNKTFPFTSGSDLNTGHDGASMPKEGPVTKFTKDQIVSYNRMMQSAELQIKFVMDQYKLGVAEKGEMETLATIGRALEGISGTIKTGIILGMIRALGDEW